MAIKLKNRISNECKKEDDKRASSFFYPYFPKGNKNSKMFSFIPSQVSLKGNVACRRHLYDESQLLRACVAPVTADNIRNPGYRPTYSCRLARPISMNSLMQAWLIHSCCPGLSFKIKNDYNTSRISCNFFLLFFIIFDIFHEILNFCTIFYTYHDFLDIIRKNEYDTIEDKR